MRFFCTWSMLVVCALSAQAQTYKVRRIEVQLDGPECGTAANIYIVLNDDDRALTAHPSDNIWVWEGGPITIPKYAHISLRFTDTSTSSGRRTPCRKPKPQGWIEDPPVSRAQSEPTIVVEKFYFRECKVGTVDVTMTMETDLRQSPIGVSYVRAIGKKPDDDESDPCNERHEFSSNEPKPFRFFWPYGESLTLNLSNAANLAEAKQLPATKLVKALVGKKDKDKVIPRDKIAFIWLVDLAKGGPAAPTISSTMNQINGTTLGALHFKSLRLTVN